MKSKWVKRTVIGVAILAGLVGLFFVGMRVAWAVTISKTIDSAPEHGFQFGKRPLEIKPLSDVKGHKLDLFFSEFVLPDEPIKSVKSLNDTGFKIIGKNYQMIITAVDRCDSALLKETFGNDLFKESYNPEPYAETFLRLSMDEDDTTDNQLIACSSHWQHYLWYGQPEHGFWKIFFMSQKESSVYGIMLLNSIVASVIQLSSLETPAIQTTLKEWGRQDAVSAYVRSKDHRLSSSIIFKSESIPPKELARKILSTFRYTKTDLPDDATLKTLITERLKAQGLNVVEKSQPKTEETALFIPK